MRRHRGIRVAPRYIPKVQLARQHKGLSEEHLAEQVGLSRSTVQSFLYGKPVDRLNFIEISQRLGLDWQEIAGFSENFPQNLPQPPSEAANNRAGEQLENDSSIDARVQQVRQHCYDKIQMLHGKMQLLDISQPIDLEHIYVDVNILEQVTSQQWLEISDLLRGFNPAADNFDRFGLGRVRQERVPGLEAVKRYSRLMVLGKPGSGKTTFLQHVAIECNQGRFQADKVPIFIRLRDFTRFAQNQDNFGLFDYINQEFRSCGISNRENTQAVLESGRGLILLDGLDEVPSEDESDVVARMEVFSQVFFNNPLIITCRIAASRYRFPSFTDVEVADFNNEQIKSFAEKWFVALARDNQEEGLAKARQFTEKLNSPENQQIKELAVTPILLHLTCLVFQSRADFPSNRARLYEQGLEILLKRWDETRGIQRDEVYRYLTLPRKKQLLSQIGAITFERGDYFFEKNRGQQLIADYLRSLPDAKLDPDELQMDSEAVLKAIEAQHGLLVERARGIYSFSHLTFQEYFTALETIRQVVSRSESQALEHLVSYINEKHWREVFLLTAGMLPSADSLLQLMKQQIDGLLAADEKLQQFLMWVNQKCHLVEPPLFYATHQSINVFTVNNFSKKLAFRLFYSTLGIIHSSFNKTINNFLLSNHFFPSRRLPLSFIQIINEVLHISCNFFSSTDFVIDLLLTDILNQIYYIHHKFRSDSPRYINACLNNIFNRNTNLEFKRSLQELREQLPALLADEKKHKEWWKENGKAWTEQLRAVMIKHRNIGHDWQFSEQQKKLLNQYYDANKLLVDCMNSAAHLTPAVREEIEETLLLPIAEIEKRGNCQDR